MSSLEFRNTLKCSLNYKHLWHFQCSIDIQIIHYRIIIITTREYKFSFNCFAQIHGIFISPTYVIFFFFFFGDRKMFNLYVCKFEGCPK